MLVSGSCCGGGEYDSDDVNGTCPVCGCDTIDGIAAEICSYSPLECSHCGSQPCQGYC
jgi:hypothetical protein